MKKWILGLWFVSISVFAAPMITKVIELHYKNAAQIIQLVQPLLQPDEKVSGTGQTLIVKVNPKTLTQIRTVLHELDKPPVTFEITIFQGDPDWLSTQNTQTVVISTPSRTNLQRRQSVRVMNGESAFVSTGEDQPVVSSVGAGFWAAGVTYDRRLVQNGLLIAPVLEGQNVKLKVKRVRQQDNPTDSQSFDQQKIATTVMAPLDQWVSLGSAEGEAPADSNTEVIRSGNKYSKNSTLYIKVTVVGKPKPRASDNPFE